jgi:hypothetical protein
MRSWRVNVQLEPGWRVSDVVHTDDSVTPTFFVYVQKTSSGQIWSARFDLDKNVFLDNLPITVDASLVRNIIRNALQQ